MPPRHTSYQPAGFTVESTAHPTGELEDGSLCFIEDNVWRGRPKKGKPAPCKLDLLQNGDHLRIEPSGSNDNEDIEGNLR